MDIRPMRPSDVDAATEMILGHGWGVRRDWLAFATSSDHCAPLLAEMDGAIVATGVGTANGSVGWIGTVFVSPDHRGKGLGRGVTQAVIDRLHAAGCATLVLVATADGRRLYERMGFEVQTRYRILEAPGLPDEAGAAGGATGARLAVRAYVPADLASVIRLDALATGEDRAHALARLASSETARVASPAADGIDGFLVRPPWGGGATVARTPEAAIAMITARRRTAGPAGRVRVGLLEENRAGLERLAGEGFTDAWSAPRMIRGAAMDWHPEMLWGQFNHAMG